MSVHLCECVQYKHDSISDKLTKIFTKLSSKLIPPILVNLYVKELCSLWNFNLQPLMPNAFIFIWLYKKLG